MSYQANRLPIDRFNQFRVVGLNYGSCPAPVREALFLKDDDLPDFLESLQLVSRINAYAISTCDRIEVYYLNNQAGTFKTLILESLAEPTNIKAQYLKTLAYEHEGVAALRHFFRVTSALDSHVVGEPQILGQIRISHRIAKAVTTIDPLLDQIFEHAYLTAKRVRTETEISEGPTSLGAAAVRIARDIFADLSQCVAGIVGTEEMAAFLEEQFKKAGMNNFIYSKKYLMVSNRSKTTATPGYCRAVSEILSAADIALACNSPSGYALTKDMVKSAIKSRKHRPIFIIDLGVPRAVEPSIAQLSEAFVYDLDDLEQLAVEGMTKRRSAMAAAEEIVEHELTSFMKKFAQRDVGSFVSEIRDALEVQLLDVLRDKPHLSAEKASYLLLNKFLHQPTTQLKELSAENKLDTETERLIRRLFIPERGAKEDLSEL